MPDYDDYETQFTHAALAEFDAGGEDDDDLGSDSWLSMDEDSDYEEEEYTESFTSVLTQTACQLSSPSRRMLDSEEEYDDEEESEDEELDETKRYDEELPPDVERDSGELIRRIEELMDQGNSLMEQLEITVVETLITAQAGMPQSGRFSYRRAQ